MIENIYDDIIKNSKIAYLKITCKKNENDKYIGINVIEQSKEFEKVSKLISGNNLFNKEATEVMINNFIKYDFKEDKFNQIVEETIRTGHYKFDSYTILDKEKKLSIDVYYLKEYFLIICSLEYNMDNRSEDIITYNWTKKLDGEYTAAAEYLCGEIECDKQSWFSNILGKRDVDVWNEEDLRAFRKNEEEVLHSKKMKTFYQILTNKNGDKVYLETTLWPLIDENDQVNGMKGISIKIDDKLVIEKTIQQNEENFREITKYCDSVFIISDKKRATYVSPSFKNVFEEDSDKLYKDINSIYNYFDLNDDVDYFKNSDRNMPKFKEGVANIKVKGNKRKYIWYKFLPIKNNKGNVEKYIGILTDITNRKKLEEENNQLKLDFFANMSHELRTPINLISSTIQLIKMNINKLSQQEKSNLDKYIDIMESNTLRMVKLVNNLLDSSRIDAGYVTYNPINGDIIYFIEDICASTMDFANVNNMNIVFDTNAEEEIVLFDQDIIERVMLNLLSNAVKFNKENGTIYVNLNIRDDEIEIRVRDEGKGIPHENKELIFKRFEQVHSINNIEKKGSGIGLYLVKSLVELHGGYINVESEIGRGSEFIVNIPKRVHSLQDQYSLNKCNSIYDKVNIEFSDI